MSGHEEKLANWPLTLRYYLGVSMVAHLAWEIVQLPLYTLWSTGTFAQRAFAVVHCTVGDAMIAGIAILIAVSLVGRPAWPSVGTRHVYVASLALGIAYTIFSEWLNVSVRASWTYSHLMPVVPVIRTGLAPLLQWIVVPTAAQWIALGHAPWRNRP